MGGVTYMEVHAPSFRSHIFQQYLIFLLAPHRPPDLRDSVRGSTSGAFASKVSFLSCPTSSLVACLNFRNLLRTRVFGADCRISGFGLRIRPSKQAEPSTQAALRLDSQPTLLQTQTRSSMPTRIPRPYALDRFQNNFLA